MVSLAWAPSWVSQESPHTNDYSYLYLIPVSRLSSWLFFLLGMGSSSLSINVALKIGWRNTCYVAGLIGMGMGLIYAFILQQGKGKQ